MRSVLAPLVLLACSATAQPRLLVGNLVDAGKRPPAPVDKAAVKLVNTNQETLTDKGRFQFALPPGLTPGSEVQIQVTSGSLRIYLPRSGLLTVPAAGARPAEVQLLPAGSKLFLEPAAVEALLAQAAKPAASPQRQPEPGPDREPGLQSSLKRYAAEYGFGIEDVEREVKAWGDQIRANRAKANVRQRALAEFQAQRFDEAASLFEESASSEGAALERIERERKSREQEERAILRRYLDDNIRAAEAFTQNLKYPSAVQIIERAANRVDKTRYPEWWAEMRTRLGSAAHNSGITGSAAASVTSLRTAVSEYRNALQIYTRDSSPQDWAWTQNNLGNASRGLGERLSGAESLENLQAAVAAFQEALQVRTRDAIPEAWAMTQNNLGIVYDALAERLNGAEAMESFRAAVAAYNNALEVRTKVALPESWAATQNNLGTTYNTMADRVTGPRQGEMLRAAIAAFKNALEVHTRETAPQSWAMTQNNLASAYETLGEQENGAEGLASLRAAIAAYKDVLQIYTRDAVPQDWAMTQTNLGAAYGALVDRLNGPDAATALRDAVTAYRAALEIRTKDTLPQAWARTQNNLGAVYAAFAERQSGVTAAENQQAALTALRGALQVLTKDSNPVGWALANDNLSRVLAGQEKWEEAVQAAENALSVQPEWSVTLGRAEGIYQDRLFRFDKAFELNARRVALGDGELEFVEKHLTTKRFDACATRAAALHDKVPEGAPRALLTAFRFACLAAQQKLPDSRAAGQQLRTELSALPKDQRTLSGARHFLGEDPSFAANATEWVHLFEALEQGDAAKASAALTALGVPQ